MICWLVEHADGARTVHLTNGDDPAAEGIDLGVSHRRVARPPREDEVWSGRGWTPDVAAVERRLLAAIEAERARRSLAALATPIERAEEYAAKAREAFGAPGIWLTAEAEASGRALEAVRAEVVARVEAKQALAARIAATARAAERSVRAARSVRAKRAAFAAIKWPGDSP